MKGHVPFQVGSWEQWDKTLREAVYFLEHGDCGYVENIAKTFTVTPQDISLDNIDGTVTAFEESSLLFRRRRIWKQLSGPGEKYNYGFLGQPPDLAISLVCKDNINIRAFFSSPNPFYAGERHYESINESGQDFRKMLERSNSYASQIIVERNTATTYTLFRDAASIQKILFSILTTLPAFPFDSSGDCNLRPFLGFDDQAQQAVFGYQCNDGRLEAHQFLPYSSLPLELDQQGRIKEILSLEIYQDSIFFIQKGVSRVKAITLNPSESGRYTP